MRLTHCTATRGFVSCGLACIATALSWAAEMTEPCKDTVSTEPFVGHRNEAQEGDSKAQHELGRKFFYGCGVKRDRAEAARWSRLAADRGLADAEFNLGVLHLNGWGVERDEAEAARWFRLAADQGLADAELGLGTLYLEGSGVERDEVKAADRGLADAEFSLGTLYMEGLGVQMSESAALEWFRKAADQGDAPAAFNVGVLLARGADEFGRDVEAAHFWFRLAEDRRYVKAAKARETLEASMTSKEISNAKARYSAHRNKLVP